MYALITKRNGLASQTFARRHVCRFVDDPIGAFAERIVPVHRQALKLARARHTDRGEHRGRVGLPEGVILMHTRDCLTDYM